MTKSAKASVAIALGAIVLIGAPVGLASGGLPRVPSYSGPYSKNDLQVRPASIEYTGGGFFAGPRRSTRKFDPLSWTRWTSASANGTGYDWVNSCRPSCSQSKPRPYPVKLRLWRPRDQGQHLIFTRMTVSFTSERPPHVGRATQEWRVSHKGHGYFWRFSNA